VKAVRVYVSQLRKMLGEDSVETRPAGYMLRAGKGAVDADVFEERLAEGRRLLADGAAGNADDVLRSALGLWRGPALADFRYETFARDEIGRLEGLRLIALEQRLEVDLALGRHAEAVPELEALVREYPLRESLRGLLMLALYRAGRQADALAAYQDARATLVEELGLDPSEALQRLEQAILRHDPSLDVAVPEPVENLARSEPPAQPAIDGLPPQPPPAPTGTPHRARRLVLAGVAVVAVVAVAVTAVLLTRGSGGLSHIGPTSVGVIDASSNVLVADIPVGFKSSLIAAGEGYVWVADPDGSTLVRIDPATRIPTRWGIEAGAVPTGVAAGEGFVWITVLKGGLLYLLKLGPDEVELRHQWPLGAATDSGFRPTVALGGDAVWVLVPATGKLWRIDVATSGKQLVSSGVGDAVSLAVDQNAVWLATLNGVERLDPGTGRALKTFDLGGVGADEVKSVALGAGSVWYARSSDTNLWRIDPETNTLLGSTTVGRGPSGIAVGEGAVWVANSRDGSVSRVDPKTQTETDRIELHAAPGGIVVADSAVWTSPGAPRA
jgi:YVTN family beta-propeller protein